jgi:hypothetical protein
VGLHSVTETIANSVGSAIIAFGLASILVTKFLDSNLSEEWRAKLSRVLRTGKLSGEAEGDVAPTWQSFAQTISKFSTELFQIGSPRSFIKTSVILSLVIILFSFSYLYFRGDDSSRTEILSLFATNRTLVLTFLFPLLATLLIDLMSAFQTIVFLEMIGRCRTVWQAAVLVYSNILVSVALFSLLFPLIIVLLLLVENQIVHTGVIRLQPVPTAQKDDTKKAIGSAIFGFFPTDQKLLQNMTLWAIETSASADMKDQGLTPSYSLTVITSREFPVERVLPFVHDAFRAAAGGQIKILSAEINPGKLLLPSSEIRLEVRRLFDGIPFSTFYRVAFNDVNLFGTKSLDLANGELLPVQASGLARSLSTEMMFDTSSVRGRDALLNCDEHLSRLKAENEADVVSSLQKCSVWSAVAASSLKIDASLLAALTSSSVIVTPFALSSLTVTIVVYFLVLAFLYVYFVGKAVPLMFKLDIIKLENIPLTVSAVLVLLFLLMPAAALATLLGY